MKKTVLAAIIFMAMCFNCFGAGIEGSGTPTTGSWDEFQSYSAPRHQTTLENQLYGEDFFGGVVTVPNASTLENQLYGVPSPPFDDERFSYDPNEPREETILPTDNGKILRRSGDGTLSWLPPEYVEPSLIQNKREVIKFYIESGDVCEAVGHHQWVDWFALPTYRECTLCNKLQRENTAPKWVDVE